MLSLLLLSFVQSVTEFLPISSSGHLLLLSFAGLSDQGLGMDILLHLGTLLAVVIYFREDVKEVLLGLLPKAKNRQLLMQLFVASLPVAVAGLFLTS